MPGFYYDPVKQKYFKIESNSFGVSSVLSKHDIAQKKSKQIEENIQKIKCSSTPKNLINHLFTTQLNGFNKKQQNEYCDHILEITKPIKLFDLSAYPKFKQLQSFKINDNNYFLINFSDDIFNFNCCLLKFDRKELEFKINNINKVNVFH